MLERRTPLQGATGEIDGETNMCLPLVSDAANERTEWSGLEAPSRFELLYEALQASA
jgi:hypothetical protein